MADAGAADPARAWAAADREGQDFLQQQDLAGAIRVYGAYLAAYPEATFAQEAFRWSREELPARLAEAAWVEVDRHGRGLVDQGEYGPAIRLYRGYLAIHPHSLHAEDVGRLCGRELPALISERDWTLLVQAAQAMAERQDFEAAIVVYRAYMTAYPQSPHCDEAFRCCLQDLPAQIQKRDWNRTHQAAWQLATGQDVLGAYRAVAQYQEKYPEGACAAAAAEELARLRPGALEAIRSQIRKAVAAREWAVASSWIAQLQQLEPADAEAAVRLKEAQAVLQQCQGLWQQYHEAYEQRQYVRCERLCREIVALHAGDPEAPPALAAVHRVLRARRARREAAVGLVALALFAVGIMHMLRVRSYNTECLREAQAMCEQGRLEEARQAHGRTQAFLFVRRPPFPPDFVQIAERAQYTQSRAGWERALQSLSRPWLDEYGGPDWAEARRQADWAAASAAQPVPGRRAYLAARAALDKACARAALMSAPKLLVRALAGGRAVPATVKQAEGPAVTRGTRGELNLAAGQAYVFQVSYVGGTQLWETAALPVAANWYGLRTQDVALAKARYPDLMVPRENSLGMQLAPVPGLEGLFGRWPVRVQDFTAFAQAAGRSLLPPKFPQEPTHPVVNVNWVDAVAFCDWLTRKEQAEGLIGLDRRYRLPTDEEWSLAVGLAREKGRSPMEKAERVKEVFPWGAGWPPPAGAGNYGPAVKVDAVVYTAPVGSFATNQYGVCDLGGNVWEWCDDKYQPTEQRRVLRGASWRSLEARHLLSSYRHYLAPSLRDDDIGFRCVLAHSSNDITDPQPAPAGK